LVTLSFLGKAELHGVSRRISESHFDRPATSLSFFGVDKKALRDTGLSYGVGEVRDTEERERT
jgi:hypothetical protein